MPDSASIRPARLEDADAVFGLLTDFATSYRPDRSTFDRHYPAILGASDADLVVANQDGVVIGYALAIDMLTLFANGVVTELIELMVEQHKREHGIGRALVEVIVLRARERGAIEVTVPTRRAGPFYEKLGFEETANYYKLPL